MDKKAVIAYVFDDPDDLNTIRAVVAASKPMFEVMENPPSVPTALLEKIQNMRVYACVGDAANTIEFFVKNGSLPMEVPEESNWEHHARQELALFGEDPEFKESILNAVKAFAEYDGHSGGSIGPAVHILADLLQFKNLTPLTSDPNEWMHVAEEVGGSPNVWQSTRRPDAFSNNGGKTYYLVSDDDRILYVTADKPE